MIVIAYAVMAAAFGLALFGAGVGALLASDEIRALRDTHTGAVPAIRRLPDGRRRITHMPAEESVIRLTPRIPTAA